jgi:hypothetical protein
MDTLAALQVYRELADWYERQGQPAMRDRFLMLAAEAAFSAGKPDEAERLRQRLLQGNPHHMLKPFSSFSQALQSTNIQIYLHDLQVNYPPETSGDLLQKLRGGASEPRMVPQTAPLIEVRDEPTLPLGGSMESLKVYPLREEPETMASSGPAMKAANLDRPEPRKQPAAPPAGNPPVRSSPLNTPAPAAHPVLPRQPAPARAARPPAAPPRAAALPPEPASPAGAGLSLLLFGMTVTAGIALALYTLARPFLPAEWLP